MIATSAPLVLAILKLAPACTLPNLVTMAKSALWILATPELENAYTPQRLAMIATSAPLVPATPPLVPVCTLSRTVTTETPTLQILVTPPPDFVCTHLPVINMAIK